MSGGCRLLYLCFQLVEGAVTSEVNPSVSLRGHLMQPTIIPLQCDSVNEGQVEETRQSQDPVLISLRVPSGYNGLSPWPREQPTGLRRRKACTEAPLFRRRYPRAPHGRLDDPRQSGRPGNFLSLPPPPLHDYELPLPSHALLLHAREQLHSCQESQAHSTGAGQAGVAIFEEALQVTEQWRPSVARHTHSGNGN